MNVYIILSICFLPFLLCFFLFKLLFKTKFSVEFIAGLLGLAAVLPISFLQFILTDYLNSNSAVNLGLFVRFMVFNGIIEEGLKALLLIFLPVKKIKFNEFFTATLLSGLCLGCFESMIYVLQYMQKTNTAASELIYQILLIRIFSADIVHTLCAGLGGLFIYSCKTKQLDITALIFSILVHGIYDFFVYFDNSIRFFAVAAILFAVIECRIHYERLKPLEAYKKQDRPAADNADKTVESALREAPTLFTKFRKSGKKN
ncbi:MAG: PrsW family glutamic-type intramembrane protease [Treponema sp.]